MESMGEQDGLQVKHAAAALDEICRTTGTTARRIGPFLSARNLNQATLRLNLQVAVPPWQRPCGSCAPGHARGALSCTTLYICVPEEPLVSSIVE